jgi:hypothetical protein
VKSRALDRNRFWEKMPRSLEIGNDITARDDSPKPDPKLRDYENIPFIKKDRSSKLTYETIEAYLEREVKPHLPNAWIDESKTKTGYEINFTKYFYEFKHCAPWPRSEPISWHWKPAPWRSKKPCWRSDHG